MMGEKSLKGERSRMEKHVSRVGRRKQKQLAAREQAAQSEREPGDFERRQPKRTGCVGVREGKLNSSLDQCQCFGQYNTGAITIDLMAKQKLIYMTETRTLCIAGNRAAHTQTKHNHSTRVFCARYSTVVKKTSEGHYSVIAGICDGRREGAREKKRKREREKRAGVRFL